MRIAYKWEHTTDCQINLSVEKNMSKISGISTIVSISSVCCGDFHKLPLWRLQIWCSLVTLGCTHASKGIGPLLYTEGDQQLKILNLLIVDRFLPLEFHIPITFSSQNHFADCIVVKTIFFRFSQRYCGSHFLWQGIATDCVKPETNPTPFEVTRQDKPRSKHWNGHCCWSTRVV